MINVDDDDDDEDEGDDEDEDEDDEDEDDKTNSDQAPSFVSRIQMIQNTLLVLDYGSFPHKMGIAMTKMMKALIISFHLSISQLV